MTFELFRCLGATLTDWPTHDGRMLVRVEWERTEEADDLADALEWSEEYGYLESDVHCECTAGADFPPGDTAFLTRKGLALLGLDDAQHVGIEELEPA